LQVDEFDHKRFGVSSNVYPAVRSIADFRSSIAAHPARLKPANMDVRRSATRAWSRAVTLELGRVAATPSLVVVQDDALRLPRG
jgi:hypothetical protein